eukprot:TRINITY_DN1350_c0_g3_i2.p2 TRINITY_DN1350_c0_g3~~TRINITY_DN1350_c0_g3_i2.p2  ORF type:complete len:217 (-),score=32.61 TRINITY_DN1350_c0_g3_i2:68-718(-)
MFNLHGWVLVTFIVFAVCKKVFRDTSGIDCESDVEPEAGRCADLFEEGACEDDWMLDGFFCITTCDFCDKKKEQEVSRAESTSIARSFGFAPFSFSSSIFVDLRSRTLRGCKCPTWIYEGKMYTGCGNPDQSPLGGWCPVTQEDCPFDPIYTSKVPVKVVYEFADGSKDEVAIGGSGGRRATPPRGDRVVQGGLHLQQDSARGDPKGHRRRRLFDR